MSAKEKPGLLALESDLSDVEEVIKKRNRRREALFANVTANTDEVALNASLASLGERLKTPHSTPREPFSPLSPEDLGVLEWAMRRALHSSRLCVLEEGELTPEEQRALAIIRANRVYEHHRQGSTPQLSSDVVREAIRALTCAWLTSSALKVEPCNTVVVMMLRAGLILGEGAYEAGVRTFGAIDAWKIPTTLETHIGSVTLPKTIAESSTIVLVDSAGATFATIRAGLEILRQHGVDLSKTRVIIYTIDLAPEGLIPFLLDEQQVEIVSYSRSIHLNQKGLIVEIGIGDVDERVMRDLDWDYGMEHWVEQGLVNPDILSRVLERTRLIEQETWQRQRASVPPDPRIDPKTHRAQNPPGRPARNRPA